MAWFSGRDSSADEGGDDSAESPWQSRGFVASAIIVGAVVACLAIWFAIGRGDGNDPSTRPSASPSVVEPTDPPSDDPTEPPATPDQPTTPPSTRPPSNNSAGGCKAKNPDQRIPRVAPPAVSWDFETDMMIPRQAVGGPAITDGSGLRHCFAHSPTGAVLAAMVTLGQIRNPDLTETVLRNRIVPGPGRTRALAETRSSPTPRNSQESSQFTGFKVIDYLPNRAIVSVAVKIDSGIKVAALPITLLWTGGDWKLVLQSDGSFNGEVAPDILQSLEGYVRFGGA
ncbi:hypothetical protein FB561_1579 [Kribbella amoyensis]|uniref:DUF8175 domain-containing protein n=1 Tax=Kribbella amoyensis TaxID=996641 RepID=A0A561BNQ4_9ACTN|nr:hypothetical protein [Kribbella amoyensis]TWD80501.1 hypothetical protein FB561_1579 [Kribbella amoyensis]